MDNINDNIDKATGYTCETCDIQCEGHGGGVPSIQGGCLCFDGTHLECLIED